MSFKKKYWEFVIGCLEQSLDIFLLFVPESIGSSPGKQGHQMAVSSNGDMFGTIGGGAMEYKTIEECKKEFSAPSINKIERHRLVHNRNHKEHWSGLSCSGEQTILKVHLSSKELHTVYKILEYCGSNKHAIRISPSEFSIVEIKENTNRQLWHYESSKKWFYQFKIGWQDKVYIIGGGHVGIALCRQLKILDFHVTLLDNRKELNIEGIVDNIDHLEIIHYKNVADFVPSTEDDYIVIMTFSSPLDSLVLSHLIKKPCAYIGMMASQTKADRIRQQMLAKGYTDYDYDQVQTPIGLPIPCKTPEEIAVSVAAQIIQTRNISYAKR